jgi:SAM-dependent methyltransferase
MNTPTAVRPPLAMPSGPVPVVPSAITPAGWDDTQADFHADTIEESDYARRVAPLAGGPFDDVLDVGAGSGALTRRCLRRGARWVAVEPNAAMRARLARLRPALAHERIDLQVEPTTWQSLPVDVRARTVLAANLGATHHEPARFFDAMSERFRATMTWVVAAQHGPSTFCLAGFLPPELHGADMRPAHERTLDTLDGPRGPDTCTFVDWTCRRTFTSLAHAQAHFLEHLGPCADPVRDAEVAAFVARHAAVRAQGVVVSCAKRSAVLRWTGARA